MSGATGESTSGTRQRARWLYTVGAALILGGVVVALTSPTVSLKGQTATCGPTFSLLFAFAPSDPAPGEGWATELCYDAQGQRFLLMLALLVLGAAFVLYSAISERRRRPTAWL